MVNVFFFEKNWALINIRISVRCRVNPRLLDPISAGFLDSMVPILRAVFAGESEDRQARVLEVFFFFAFF